MPVISSDPKYAKLLEIIYDNGGGIGAGRAQGILLGLGIALSEPTVGRALRDLEREGLLAGNGSRGRNLTPAGLKYLQERRRERSSMERASDFAKSLDPKEKEELMDILVARRAVEIELAKLAAANITPGEMRKLREAVDESERLMRLRLSVSEADTRFHSTIASASRNKTLAAALELIWHGGEYAKKLGIIRYRSKTIISDDHEKIIRALDTGIPENAGKAMESHINNVLYDVEALSDEIMENGLREPLKKSPYMG
jgi:GntR family L-lactate dehydrogenase operon transcriptional regulator